MKLRDYQSRSIEMLYKWLSENKGHVCVVLPTGAGKSVIIAELIRGALQGWPETKALMLCHQKELLEQNAEKMRSIWPGAPMGIYSASVGKKQIGEPILFAGIQSVRNKSKDIGHVDLCIIDECHCISHKDEGGYRRLINELLEINPSMRIIGYSATPYRLGHGLITDKPALFDALIEPVTIEELIFKGFLATLQSKPTAAKLDTTGVHKRGGEFIESELQAAVDTHDNNESVVREVIARAGERKAWLFFCAGVQHSEHIRDELLRQGVTAECVTGATSKGERERIIADFKAGKIRALTNANVLTTGFDYPDIDLIAMLRPTMSASLYVQMAGRGLRPKSHTDHCLVLDFAGAVSTHGPITAVKPPQKGGKGEGDAPVKVCEKCNELVHISVMTCPVCGWAFPQRETKPLTLHTDDIMGIRGHDLDVTSWMWWKHVSAASGKEMLKVTYYGALSDVPVTEYLTVLHDGVAGQRALAVAATIARHAGVNLQDVNDDDLSDLARRLTAGRPPKTIEYTKDGKFYRVMRRDWNAETF